jgi:hypothetical protein
MSAEGADILLTYALADRLGKTAAEIENQMPVAEREGWIAYLQRESQIRRAAQK